MVPDSSSSNHFTVCASTIIRLFDLYMYVYLLRREIKGDRERERKGDRERENSWLP